MPLSAFAYAQDDQNTDSTVTCDEQSACPDMMPTAAPPIEVGGVQTSSDDARQPDEAEPFIINDGFGD